jgi:hypothetical protein
MSRVGKRSKRSPLSQRSHHPFGIGCLHPSFSFEDDRRRGVHKQFLGAEPKLFEMENRASSVVVWECTWQLARDSWVGLQRRCEGLYLLPPNHVACALAEGIEHSYFLRLSIRRSRSPADNKLAGGQHVTLLSRTMTKESLLRRGRHPGPLGCLFEREHSLMTHLLAPGTCVSLMYRCGRPRPFGSASYSGWLATADRTSNQRPHRSTAATEEPHPALAPAVSPLVNGRPTDAESADSPARLQPVFRMRGGWIVRGHVRSAVRGSSSWMSGRIPSPGGGARRARAGSQRRKRRKAPSTNSSDWSREEATPAPSGSGWPSSWSDGSGTSVPEAFGP